jgi:hypothetical protein
VARDIAMPPEAQPSEGRPESDSQSESESEPGRDSRADVMAEYFDVMRGFLEQQRAVVESWHGRSGDTVVPTPAAGAELPFLGELVEHEAHRLVARCLLSLDDNFLRSHVLSGRVSESAELSGLACVPLMVSVELMAEACSLLAGSGAVQVIENVRAFDWIALDDEALTLEVHAEVVDAERSLYRATIINGAEPVVSADFQFEPAWRLHGLPSLGPARPSVWSGPELYTTGMFHGPVFQSVRRIAGWNETGIDAELFEAGLQDFLVAGETPRLVLNPVLLDAVGQVAAYWVAQQAGVDFNCFPSTIGRIELYAPCPASLPGLTMQARQRPLEVGAAAVSAPRTWDFECRDASGAPFVARRRPGQRLLPGAAHLLRSPARSLARPARPAEHGTAERRRCRCGRCRTSPRTSAPSRTRSSCASWRTPCSASRSGPNGARSRARCGAGANGCSAGPPSKRRCGWPCSSRPESFSTLPTSWSCTMTWARLSSTAGGAAIWPRRRRCRSRTRPAPAWWPSARPSRRSASTSRIWAGSSSPS